MLRSDLGPYLTPEVPDAAQRCVLLGRQLRRRMAVESIIHRRIRNLHALRNDTRADFKDRVEGGGGSIDNARRSTCRPRIHTTSVSDRAASRTDRNAPAGVLERRGHAASCVCRRDAPLVARDLVTCKHGVSRCTRPLLLQSIEPPMQDMTVESARTRSTPSDSLCRRLSRAAGDQNQSICSGGCISTLICKRTVCGPCSKLGAHHPHACHSRTFCLGGVTAGSPPHCLQKPPDCH